MRNLKSFLSTIILITIVSVFSMQAQETDSLPGVSFHLTVDSISGGEVYIDMTSIIPVIVEDVHFTMNAIPGHLRKIKQSIKMLKSDLRDQKAELQDSAYTEEFRTSFKADQTKTKSAIRELKIEQLKWLTIREAIVAYIKTE